jgi:RHS repeat-associated protein
MTPFVGVDGQPKRFTGHERDSESGLDYMIGRYYAAPMGRFLSVDTGDDSDPLNPQSWNKYTYVRNNPINATDPTGEFLETLWDVGNAIAGAVSAVQNVRAGNYGSAAIDAVGAIVDTVAAAVPFVPGGAGAAIKAARGGAKLVDAAQTANRLDNATDGARGVASASRGTSSGPDFVVTGAGDAVPIPNGATGPTAPKRGSGMVFDGGSGGKGMDDQVTGVRIMDSSGDQGRRVNYMNRSGQTVDPKTGRTISRDDPRGHIPLKEPNE